MSLITYPKRKKERKKQDSEAQKKNLKSYTLILVSTPYEQSQNQVHITSTQPHHNTIINSKNYKSINKQKTQQKNISRFQKNIYSQNNQNQVHPSKTTTKSKHNLNKQKTQQNQ
jgi:hypothetical protein